MPATKKIVADPDAMKDFITEQGVKAIPEKSKEIVIDFDATDDPLHGHQEGAYFHGYYYHYCYLPLYALCGNILLWAELRECGIVGVGNDEGLPSSNYSLVRTTCASS